MDRIDGFDEPIRVEADPADLPPGVFCTPVVIGPGKTSVPLVFEAAADAPIGQGQIRIHGNSLVDGRPTIAPRPRRGPDLADREHSRHRPDGRRGRHRRSRGVPFMVSARLDPEVSGKTTFEIHPGAKVAIKVNVQHAGDWNAPVQLSGFDLPNNARVNLVTIPPTPGNAATVAEAKVELVLPNNLKPGPYTFTINGAGQVPRDYFAQRDPAKPRGNNVRGIFPSNPITIHVTPVDKTSR